VWSFMNSNLSSNKDPCLLNNKRLCLLAWHPMKVLLNDRNK